MATISRHSLLDHASSKFVTAAANMVQRKAVRITSEVTGLEESSLIGNDIVRVHENIKYMQASSKACCTC